MPTIGAVVCHNDLYRGNVVFPDGRAVGLIDFDLAHPADPVWDLAVAAWHWVPLSDGWRSDVPPTRWPELLKIFVEAYGVEPALRHRVVESITAFLRNVPHRALAAGRDTQQVERDERVLAQHRHRLLATLRL